MSNIISPLVILMSMLDIEGYHRTPTSYDYQGCDTDPCGWCQFIRPWAAYKMEEFGIEREGEKAKNNNLPPRSSFNLGDLCRECAAARCGYPLKDHHKTTHNAECKQCKLERMVSHWSNFEWSDYQMDLKAQKIREAT